MKTNLHDNPASGRLRHGRLAVTLISKQSGDHITLRLRCKNRNLTKRYITLDDAAIITADVPHARNEDGTHTSGGDRVGWMHPYKGWKPNKGADEARYWALTQLWRYLTTGELHEKLELKLENFCSRCSRPLNDPESIDRGVGPECYGKETGSQHQRKETSIDNPEQYRGPAQTKLPVGG